MKNVNSSDFKSEILDSKIPVVMDAYADWCGPCKAISPIFEEMSKEFEGRIKFVKVDIEKNQDVATTHKIMSIPAFIIFKDGVEISRKVGIFKREEFSKELSDLL